MAKFEEVLPALRAGKKVTCDRLKTGLTIEAGEQGWEFWGSDGEAFDLPPWLILRANWEVVEDAPVPEPKRVADYWVDSRMGAWIGPKEHKLFYMETYEVGKQPEGAVLIPGTERTEESREAVPGTEQEVDE